MRIAVGERTSAGKGQRRGPGRGIREREARDAAGGSLCTLQGADEPEDDEGRVGMARVEDGSGTPLQGADSVERRCRPVMAGRPTVSAGN